MARLKDMAVSTRDGFNIDPRRIETEPGFNARDFSTPENQAHVAQLKLSIAANGVKMPLTIRKTSDDKIYLVDGESRWRATMELIAEGVNIVSVPCQAEGVHDDPATRTASMVIRNTGKQLSLLEQGEAYRRLTNYGWDDKKIADTCGYTEQHIKDCLLLVSSEPTIQGAVRAGLVSGSAAISVMRRSKEKATGIIAKGVDAAVAAGKKKVSGAELRRTIELPRVAPSRRFLTGDQCEKIVGFLEQITRCEILLPAVVAETMLREFGLWPAGAETTKP